MKKETKMAPPNLKKLLEVKIKPRQDSYTDQFSRIFMVKMMMLTAAVTGISWMKDKLTCIIPKSHDTTSGFVSKACWMNGLYVYRGLKPIQESFYYGIPSDITYDGVDEYGALCSTLNKARQPVPSCQPLEKTFFLQYQWFPLGVAALGFMYYLPYLLFRIVNADMQELKNAIKGKTVEEIKYEDIIAKFFIHKSQKSISNLRARVLLNILVKVLYVVANVAGFLVLDISVNGYFVGFGGKWNEWINREHEQKHDYTRPNEAKAGHYMLPGFGLCQVHTSAKDVKHVISNTHTFVCELSQHVLYQYILIVLWYTFIIGISISILGLLKHVFGLFSVSFVNTDAADTKELHKTLTAREKEYLKFIRRKNMPVFAKLVQELNAKKFSGTPSVGSNPSSYNPCDKEKMMMES